MSFRKFESSLIQEIADEAVRAGCVELTLGILEDRFGVIGPSIGAGLAQVKVTEKLLLLGRLAAGCASLKAFEDCLAEELAEPPPASTRSRREPRKTSE